ncbi:MAG: hypothetical protein A2Y12_10640 [Planctomycetes bacterium GWF2_42_9]|nr:MAG: hypothetical protein A2Y12_10640 [Planctomycetes bacterium GWF2_42_9]
MKSHKYSITMIIAMMILFFYGLCAQAIAQDECIRSNTPIIADLNGDCRVDFQDFVIFASQWLDSSEF